MLSSRYRAKRVLMELIMQGLPKQSLSDDSDAETTTPEESDSKLSGFIGYNLKRVLSLVKADLAQVLATFNLRIVSFSALSVVVQRPGINQTELAEVLKIERSNLVQIVDELANRKLIARTPVANDRRRHALMPTAGGRKLLDAAQSDVVEHEVRVFSMLTDDERADLKRILALIRAEWKK